MWPYSEQCGPLLGNSSLFWALDRFKDQLIQLAIVMHEYRYIIELWVLHWFFSTRMIMNILNLKWKCITVVDHKTIWWERASGKIT